ncbi:PTS system, sucrose-specific IIBC component [Spiroplasma helicoides]|uniref:PTS system, sucrose-specific IIBC component n=1 Tax=Spiroplasma helicoides TaxID=216938 RepID=A0A1B3SKK5_9MOLU|nr:PTS transporter subunit EIIC [Spiroplasma helicoides]AOG60445.1 PTS system, sucrose-specific IIBC component [Spiroplasma helicoides]
MNKSERQELMVQNILEKVGGSDNVKDVYNCATRMRLTLVNPDLAKINELKIITNIRGALWANGELQLIIGAEVSSITELLKSKLNNNNTKKEIANTDFNTKKVVAEQNVSLWRRFLKSVSAFFGPLIPFLIGVGLIMAFQQFLIRTHLGSDPSKGTLGVDYNMFDYVLNVISSNGFKMMGVIAMWSVVRYLGGKVPTALALALLMVSPIIPEAGIDLFKLGDWQISIKPFYSTILVFIVMGVIIAYSQKAMEKHFHPVANFILNPFLTILIGGFLAFFVMGPIMGIVENALLKAFNWFMNLPIGIGALIVGLTWQPLVVLGVHNILFFAAVADLSVNNNPSIFLAAAFAAAWAQMGATIAVGLKTKKTIDKSAAFLAALPGIISGPTESCIYGVNLPKGLPFLTGVLAGGIGGWMIGIFKVTLDNLAGLGGIVGFLAYTDDLVLAIVIDLASLGLGILITYFLWKEEKTEKTLTLKTTSKFAKLEHLKGLNDYSAQELIRLVRKSNKKSIDKEWLLNNIEISKNEIIKINKEIEKDILTLIENIKGDKQDKVFNNELIKKLKVINSDRQVQLNNVYNELKKSLADLKKLNVFTKKHYKLSVKKSNLEYTINRFTQLREDKNASLFNKGQKLLGMNNKEKMEKGRQLVEVSNTSNYKLAKIEALKSKVVELEKLLSVSEKDLSGETLKYYSNIEGYVNKVESIKNKDLTIIKYLYYNDIHSLEIKENLLKPRIIQVA